MIIFVILFSACSILNKKHSTITQSLSWKNIPVFQQFLSPWNEKPFGKTTFQYQNDSNWFYFLFNVTDKDIQLSNASSNNQLNVLQSDRVELFFAKDSLMKPYYTFEMDAANRLFDARCAILTNSNNNHNEVKQINSDWQIDQNDLQFKATRIKNGYKIEGRIAMTFLKEKQLIKHNQLWCGIQRADYNANKPVQWICAKDPKTKKPDFHNWGVFVELTITYNK